MNISSPSDKGPHRLRDRFREETGRAVLAAAEQVFAEEGLNDASMAQIAQRAGVAVGTLYNHFKDREALLVALSDQRKVDLLEKIDRRQAELSDQPFRRQLTGFLETFFDHFEEHRPFLVLLFVEQIRHSKGKEVPRAIHQRIETLLKVGHREKVLRADSSRSFGVFLLGAIRAMFLREQFGAPPLDSGAAVASIVEFFMSGAGR